MSLTFVVEKLFVVESTQLSLIDNCCEEIYNTFLLVKYGGLRLLYLLTLDISLFTNPLHLLTVSLDLLFLLVSRLMG